MQNIKINLPVKVRDIQKGKKNNWIHISVFDSGNKEKLPICVSKNSFTRHLD